MHWLSSIRITTRILSKLSFDDKQNKKGSTQFMHYLYAPISINGAPFIAKLTIEEYDVDGKTRAYNLRRIEMPKLSRAQFSDMIKENRGKYAYNSDALSVAQLFDLVKTYDPEFKPHPVHESMIEEGQPKVFYHGSPAQFTAFDKRKAKSSGYYGKGFYFSDSQSHAGTYGNTYSVYLNIKEPLKQGETTITREQAIKYLETSFGFTM